MILEFNCVDGGMHPIRGKVWHRFPTCGAEDGARYDRYLCSALFMTMQASDDCAKVLALLDLVQTGQSAKLAFGLNNTDIIFTAEGAQVDILIEDETTDDGLFGLAEFRKAVVAWNEFLSEPCIQERSVKVDLA